MSDMTESGSNISIRAEKLVQDELAMWVKRKRVIATECRTALARAEDVEVQLFASELYKELLAVAPDVFRARARRIAEAEKAADSTTHSTPEEVSS